MSEADRIKLAEAMGWTQITDYNRANYGISPRYRQTEPYDDVGFRDTCLLIPDPFTNASDDYQVLDWAIGEVQEGRWTMKQWELFKDYFREVRMDWNIWNYEIGLFAKAALHVIVEDSSD